MARLLIVNPNTTGSVTAQLRERAAQAAPPGGRLDAVTAAFGASYIADEPGAAIAAHAGLDAYAQAVLDHGSPDAVLIGCFGDPGLEAMRAIAVEPVHGLAEAAMAEAARQGRFAIVTGGLAWPPMLRRLAGALGLEPALCGIVAIDRTGGELVADPASAVRHLVEACETAVARHRPDVIVLGGAALTGFAPSVAAALPLPLIDSVETAVRVSWASAAHRATQRAHHVDPLPLRSEPKAAGLAWSGLSPALQALLFRAPGAAPA